MKKIDACGLSCPEPIIKLREGIKTGDDVILLVDNKTSVETCTRFANSRGYGVQLNENDGVFELTITK